MELLLRIEGIRTTASDDSLYAFVISISTGEVKFDQIVAWLKENTASL